MQAILSASAMHDEYVKELLVSYGKVIATSLRGAKMFVSIRQALRKSSHMTAQLTH